MRESTVVVVTYPWDTGTEKTPGSLSAPEAAFSQHVHQQNKR